MNAAPAIYLITCVAIKTAGLFPVFVSKLFEELIKNQFLFLLHVTTMLVCTISKKRRGNVIFLKRTLN